MSTTILAAAGDMVEFSEPGWLGAITAGVLAILGAVFIFVSARAMYLAPDALSQVNMVGPAIGVGLPLLISANLVYSWSTEGFILGELIRAIVAITATNPASALAALPGVRAVIDDYRDLDAVLSRLC